MFKVKNLLKGIFSSIKHVPKKAYTNGLIVISGCLVVTFLIIGTNGFKGAGKNVSALEEKNYEETFTSEDENSQMEEEPLTVELEQNHIEPSLIVVEKELVIHNDKIASKEDDDGERTLHTIGNQTQVSELVNISANNYEALLKIVEAEATNEDMIGKIMVANVVLNRVESKNFPNNVYDVVHQKLNGKAQFSPIDDGRYYSLKLSKSTKEAVGRALKGEDYSNGALFFVARSMASSNAVSWFDNNLTKVAQYGVHEFFK